MTEFGELEQLDESDDAILRTIRTTCDAADPVPVGMIERIQFEMSLAALRAEIAELEAAEPAQVRGEALAVTDTMTFRSSSLSLMVRLARPGEGGGTSPTLDVECWASEPGAIVELWSNGKLVGASPADDRGRVEFVGVAPATVRFIVRPSSGPPIATPAVQL